MNRLAKLALIFVAGAVLIAVGCYALFVMSAQAMVDIIDRSQKDLQSKSVKEQEKNRSAITGSDPKERADTR